MRTADTLIEVQKDMKRGPPSARHGLRNYLRAATVDDHAGLDAQLGDLNWGSVQDYRYFLEASAGALLPIEAALIEANVMQIFPDWERRSRRSAILSDLERIGGRVSCLAAQPCLGFEGVLGTMYVLEGSRLGAKVLLTRIAEASDPTILRATAYLSHGSGQKLWQTFIDGLEQQAARIERGAEAAVAARQAFRLFARMFASVDRSRC
jgi:heme oxygenase